MNALQIATVKYKIATYEGIIKINCSENDEDDLIIERAKNKIIKEFGAFPIGYLHFEITERQYVY